MGLKTILKQIRDTNQNFDFIVGPNEIEVTDTSQTLEQLGLTIHSDISRITFIPANTGIFWADGFATVGVNPLPAGGVELECVKCDICTREFITSGAGIKMSVVQEGGGDVE